MTSEPRTRRWAVASIGSAVLVGLAGCVGVPDDGIETQPTDEGTTDDGTTEPDTATATRTPSASPTATATETTGASAATEVAVGPEGRLRFVPETVEISVGDTVRWTFESPGHNVTAKAGASEKVSIPDDAEPFASYEGDQHFAIDEEGSTYEHTFSVPGEYVYVCAPHEDQGMVGTVVVTE